MSLRKMVGRVLLSMCAEIFCTEMRQHCSLVLCVSCMFGMFALRMMETVVRKASRLRHVFGCHCEDSKRPDVWHDMGRDLPAEWKYDHGQGIFEK